MAHRAAAHPADDALGVDLDDVARLPRGNRGGFSDQSKQHHAPGDRLELLERRRYDRSLHGDADHDHSILTDAGDLLALRATERHGVGVSTF